MRSLGDGLTHQSSAVLRELLAPRSVAVVGASEVPGKVGTGVFRNLLGHGYSGALYAVNSKGGSVGGVRAYRRISEVPPGVELAVLCTPAQTIPGLIDECGAMGIRGVLVITAGFRELGEQGRELEAAVMRAVARYPGMRLLGPNCLGLIHPASRLSASFANGMPKVGSLAFLSQSGALCTALLDWSLREGIGFSHFVSVGNQLDVGFADLLDYLAQDPSTKSAMMYIESISKPHEFLEAAKRFASCKPLIAYKAGRFTQSAHAACSHTGAMAGEDSVYQAALDRCGVHRVMDMASMIQCAELLGQSAEQVRERVAIVTNAGGPGVMAVDSLLELKGTLATLSNTTLEKLESFLPPNWSRGNPVDVIGDADPERFSKAVQIVLDDPAVDTLLAILSPQSMTDPTTTAKGVAAVKIAPGKRLLASWLGGVSMQAGVEILQLAGIRHFEFPEQAIRAIVDLVKDTARRVELVGEADEEAWKGICATAGGTEFTQSSCDEILAQCSVTSTLPKGSRYTMSEVESKRLLELYGLKVPGVSIARSADEAALVSERIGYPVVMKIYSMDITHKTDVGGVKLGLQTREQVQACYERMLEEVRLHCPSARLDGVTLQPMIDRTDCVELILGIKRDPTFGPVVMVGFGGVAAELFADRVVELLPIGPKRAESMLKRLKCWPLLDGYRGKPRVAIDEAIKAIELVAILASQCEWIEELDINPLLVGPRGAVALDGRVVVKSPS